MSRSNVNRYKCWFCLLVAHRLNNKIHESIRVQLSSASSTRPGRSEKDMNGSRHKQPALDFQVELNEPDYSVPITTIAGLMNEVSRHNSRMRYNKRGQPNFKFYDEKAKGVEHKQHPSA